jgi:hypothetical protein
VPIALTGLARESFGDNNNSETNKPPALENTLRRLAGPRQARVVPPHGIPHVKFWVDPHGGIALTTGEAETTTLVAGIPTPPVSCTAVAPAPPTALVEDA